MAMQPNMLEIKLLHHISRAKDKADFWAEVKNNSVKKNQITIKSGKTLLSIQSCKYNQNIIYQG